MSQSGIVVPPKNANNNADIVISTNGIMIALVKVSGMLSQLKIRIYQALKKGN
jgi:hypothetical protein